MDYIEAPDYRFPEYKTKVFLAGGIPSILNWQQKVGERMKDLPVSVFNPRRSTPEELDEYIEKKEQIEWEFARIREADIVFFWFSKGSPNPISLFEYGSALERKGQILIVGADPLYEKRINVEIQTKLLRPEIQIGSTIDEGVRELRRIIDERQSV